MFVIMSKTRQKILAKSLKLFNTKGVDNISLRSISTELNISVGNLQYHFKKREDIIHELYFQLVNAMDSGIKAGIQSDEKLKELFNLTYLITSEFYKYRFIFQDFNSITHKHPKIKEHYKELIKYRKLQFLSFTDDLVRNDLMRAEILPNEYDNLFIRIQILSDFWMSSAAIQSKDISKTLLLRYADIINETLYPYLTTLGTKQYLSASNSFKNMVN